MPHGLPQRARAGVPPGFRRGARAGLAAILSLAAAILSLAFIAAASSPARADQARRSEWWLRALHITNAWETTRGAGVTIAVLGTGVDPAQPDLTGSVTTGPDYTNSGRTAGGPFWGINGTEVASLIAGHGHGAGQANGIVGVAPAARILSVRVTLESNDPQLASQTIAAGLPDAIAHGIRWAVRHDASVIDLPLDPVTAPGAPGSGGSRAERAAVSYALAKHAVLVAPAGDGGAGGDPVNYPAAYHGVIAVGAFDRHFVKTPFTSHRPYVTVTAAGAGVTAAGPFGTYPQLNSTSAASAMVAGIAALIRAQFPTLTPAQVTKALTASTVHRPRGARGDGSGSGTVDAVRALTAAAGIAEAVPKSAASASTPRQAPPSPPAVHPGPIHRNIRGILIEDAVIAGTVFLVLLGLIFGIPAWRRRHARSARLAEVRAAAQVPVRKAAQVPARKNAPAAAKKPAAKKPAAKKPAAKKPASSKAATKTAKAAAKERARSGDRAPAGAASTAAAGSTAGARKAAGAGSLAGVASAASPGSEPQFDPAGFIPAPLGSAVPPPRPPGFTGSASPAFTGSASGFTGSAATFTGSGFTGSASGITGPAPSGFAVASTSPSVPVALPGLTAAAGPGPAAGPGAAAGLGPAAGSGAAAGLGPASGPGGAARPGAAAGPAPAGENSAQSAPGPGALPSGDPTAPATTGGSTPPWARMQSDPGGAAIPDGGFPGSGFPGSAFPGTPAAPPTGETTSGPGLASGAARDGAGLNRPGSRLAQGPRQPRMPQVSGHPPWEPAPEPDSELPWVQRPAPPPAGPASLPKRDETRPDLPWWDELAQEAWPGGPKLAGPHSPIPPAAAASERPGQRAGPAFSRTARVVPAAGLVPPQPDPPERARPAGHRPGNRWDFGARPFREPQADPAAAAGREPGTGRPGVNPSTGAATGPAAVSQPGFSPARRPSLALPRRIGSAMARQAGGGGVPGRDAGLAAGGTGASPIGGTSGAALSTGTSGAGPTGATSGQGFTGTAPGQGHAGTAPGQGFAGNATGQGPGGATPGEGFTGNAPGQGFTGTATGQGFTGTATGEGFARTAPAQGPAGAAPGQGFARTATGQGPAGTASGEGFARTATGEGPGAATSGEGPVGGMSGAGPADAGPAGAGATGTGGPGASWPRTGTSHPPFPPAPRPATDPASLGAGQPEQGPFPRAIRPPMDPAGTGATPGRAIATGGRTQGAGATGARTPSTGPPFAAGPSGGSSPGQGPASPRAGQDTRGSGAAAAGQPQPAATFPAAKPKAESAKPKTGVPPWEITDSFLAVPPADAGGPSRPGTVRRPASPAAPGQDTAPDSADSAEGFLAADPDTVQRSFPQADSDDSTEIFPAIRPRVDMEDAFRLFPPVRGTDSRGTEDQPPAAGED